MGQEENTAGSTFPALHAQVSANNIAAAIAELREALRKAGANDLLERLSNTESDYRLMLSYMADGAPDPERPKILNQLRQRLHDLIDTAEAAQQPPPDASRRQKAEARQERDRADIAALVAEYKQATLLQPDDVEALERLCAALDRQRLEEREVNVVFDYIVRDADTSEPHAMFVLGALAHNLACHHNRHAASALIDTLGQSDLSRRVAARAAVCLVADILSHQGRWDDDEQLLDKLRRATACDSPMAQTLRGVVFCVAKTNITSQIEQFIDSEMAQEIGKIARQMMNRDGRRSGYHQITNDDIEQIFGPGVQGVMDKFSQLAQWQMEGADVGYATHRSLKGSPFFGSDINWFRPFAPGDPVLADKRVEAGADPTGQLAEFNERLVRTVASLPLCDSDKFSTLSILEGMQRSGIEPMLINFENEARQWRETHAGHSGFPTADGEASLAADSLVKDLYRAFTLAPDRFGQTPLFDEAAWPMESPAMGSIFDTPEAKDALGRSLVKHYCWQAASRLYAEMSERDESDADILRKYALCVKEAGFGDEAMELLRRAELLDDTNVWTKNTLAQSYCEKGDYRTALRYFAAAAALRPATPLARLVMAQCHMMLGEFNEATNICLGMTFDTPEVAEGYYGSALGKMGLGDLGSARRYIDMAAENDAHETAGTPNRLDAETLLALCERQFRKAKALIVEHMRTATEQRALSVVRSSGNVLAKYGMSDTDISLFKDFVRYK